MLVVADCLRVYAVVIEELVCVARVFAGDEIDVAENLKGAVRYVCKIADRSRNEIQGAKHEAILQER